MNTFYNVLTGSSTLQGIKNIDVFYDTLFINIKADDSLTSQKKEYVLINRILFNYDTNVIDSDTGNVVFFGDTKYNAPYASDGTCFIKNILLPHSKTVLMCGLSAFGNNSLTANYNGSIIQGGSYVPVVYHYDLNSQRLTKLYPSADDAVNWTTYVLGNFLSAHTPVVSFNNDTDNLNFLFKTTLSSNNTSVLINSVNDITFKYIDNNMTLTDVRQLTSLSANNNFNNFKLIENPAYIDNTKLIMSYNNNSVQLFNLH